MKDLLALYKQMVFHQIYCPKCYLFYILETIKGPCPVCGRIILAYYYKEHKGDKMQKRGQLTQRIKDKSKKLLGYEIGVTELRLMPYVLYVMMNSQKIDIRHCNQNDRDILQKWRKAGHIEGGASGLQITEEFWNILCELVRLGYVDLDD